jgi:hypothetical protein
VNTVVNVPRGRSSEVILFLTTATAFVGHVSSLNQQSVLESQNVRNSLSLAYINDIVPK